MNLYLGKKEARKDNAAEELRETLAPVTDLHFYRNPVEAIHRTPGRESEIFLGLPKSDATYTTKFLELLRVLEMQDVRLTRSPATREGIARSIQEFLKAYARQNPDDAAAVELSTIPVKTMAEFR